MDISGGPPPPPPPAGSVVGHIEPELLRTNRQILEQMRESQEESRRVRALALELEDHRASERAAAAYESRARHEETMHMFRANLNPHAEAMAAMQAGAASLHQAAQDVSASAAQHREMAADSSHLFMTAIKQGIEALQVATSSGGPPPPPPPGGAAMQSPAQRPDEMPLAGPDANPTIDAPMNSKRGPSPMAQVESRPKRALIAAARAASRGASANAGAHAAPATRGGGARCPRLSTSGDRAK